MSTTFSIDAIEAKSDVPLYLYLNPGHKFIHTAWQVLWHAPDNPTPNSAAAFDLSASGGLVALAVMCRFGSSFVGRVLTVEGLLNGLVAVSSTITIPGTAPFVVGNFGRADARTCPVAYAGDFQWRLVQGTIVLATFRTSTALELYTVVALPRCGPIMAFQWGLADFYRFTTQAVFNSPFKYENVHGVSHYSSIPSYKLDQYFRDLESESSDKARVNTSDMAGIIQVVLSLFPNYDLVRWSRMGPYGYINTTALKGWPGECNNPFWGNSEYYDNPMAPVNYKAGQKERSAFALHAFIVAPVSPGNMCILDATNGPHTGNENMDAYIRNAIDHKTDYYSRHPYYGPGTPANVIQRPGVTSITHLPATVPTHALATGATVISSAAAVESAFAEAAPSAEIESAPSTTEFSSVDRAMERAKVTNADPARFSHIYPITLKYVLEQISKLKLTFQTVGLGETGSELQLTLGTFPDAMEVTLAIFDSHKAAITGMRQTLLCISAPLDVAFAQTIPLGQYSLQGVGGGGYILFVRGNVFVKMAGLTSCEELGMIAGEVDKFLKEKEGGFTSLPKPRIECPEISGRVVKVGEIFEVAVEVADAGWMTAFTDAEIAQLLEMDGENATFKFYATAAGNFDIRLVFAHKDTLQTTTATVHVEVVG